MPDIQSRCLHGSVAHTAAVCCTLSACGENVQPSLGGAALQHAAAATAWTTAVGETRVLTVQRPWALRGTGAAWPCIMEAPRPHRYSSSPPHCPPAYGTSFTNEALSALRVDAWLWPT